MRTGTMDVGRILTTALLLAFALCGSAGTTPAAGDPGKATSNVGLFPNDFGPAAIDVSSYPPEMRRDYHLFLFKCSACHTIARPINAQYVELSADEIAKAKTTQPELFKDELVWQVEPGIWDRYVKWMMRMPGCPVREEDGKKIHDFLAYDSVARKTGANAAQWRQERSRLVSDFRQKYPAAFKKLFGDDAPAPASAGAATDEKQEHSGGGK